MAGILSYGWYFLLIAMTGDLVVSYILSKFYKGYSNLKMSISALGNPASPVRIPFNIWMLTEGILFLLAIPSVYKGLSVISFGTTLLLVIFIAVFAVGACIFTCFFSVNESKEEVTLASRIHGFGSVSGFMLFLFAPLLTAMISFIGDDILTGVISSVSFASALLFFALFVMSDKPQFKGTKIDNEGLWQRLNLVSMYLPLAYVAVTFIVKQQS